MENIITKVEGDTLWLGIKYKEELGHSKSGKNINVATSRGNKYIEEVDLTIGLNAYRSAQ